MWHDWINIRFRDLKTIRTPVAGVNKHSARLFNTVAQTYLNFVSNDYLGLANHPQLVMAATECINTYGMGSTGAITMSGYTEIQKQLQLELSAWLGFESSLVFNSGYQLNSTIYSQLTDTNTIIWLDKRCHASHIDGVRLAQAVNHTKFNTFTPQTIAKMLDSIIAHPHLRHIVISEGVFSMDGSCTYLAQLLELRNNTNNVLLVIDDAHGIGVSGTNGCGSLGSLSNNGKVDLLIGTMGKALGSHGGFICGNNYLIDYLAQTVRGRIFTTALPPVILASSRASILLLQSHEGEILRHKLKQNICLFQQLCQEYNLPIFEINSNTSPIQLLCLNLFKHNALTKEDLINQEKPDKFKLDSASNLILTQLTKDIVTQLRDAGFYTGMICYPTVARHLPRIRISLNSTHTANDITELCKTLAMTFNLLHTSNIKNTANTTLVKNNIYAKTT